MTRRVSRPSVSRPSGFNETGNAKYSNWVIVNAAGAGASTGWITTMAHEIQHCVPDKERHNLVYSLLSADLPGIPPPGKSVHGHKRMSRYPSKPYAESTWTTTEPTTTKARNNAETLPSAAP